MEKTSSAQKRKRSLFYKEEEIPNFWETSFVLLLTIKGSIF